MRLLLLTTYYPPDTAIAAVRPYMLAKYFSKLGHTVTVLRSGEINKSCEHFFDELPGVRVISYLGKDSPAEAFDRGEWKEPQTQGKSRIAFLPERIRFFISGLYHWFMQAKETANHMEQRNSCLEKQKEALDKLKAEGNSFDIIFSTFGEIENIFAGKYAAKIFNCKLIQDFRDAVAPSYSLCGKTLKKMKTIQTVAVHQADAVTAVSYGLLSELFYNVNTNVPGMILYNGYEPITTTATSCENNIKHGLLSICYTGQLYAGLRDFSPMLQALKTLKDQGRIDLSKVRIHYAGPDFDYLRIAASQLQLCEILVDHGYVSRSEAAQLQNKSDIFTVLSWNTKTSQGILTGKFYEGIRSNKPILSIVNGNVPHSELSLLNEKYCYGFCYETCQKDTQFSQLCDFLYAAYRQKMEQGHIDYCPNPALFADFQYDTLAEKLETLCCQLLGANSENL